MQWQDWTCRCRQDPPLDDIIEIWNDCAKHPETPRFVSSGEGSRHASHQQNARYLCRRCPGSDIALGLIVEKPFSYESSPVVAGERRGADMFVHLSERAVAKRTSDTPAKKLASKNGPRFVTCQVTARAQLYRFLGKQAPRRLCDIREGRAADRGRIGGEHAGDAEDLILIEMEISGAKR
ncbi:hypothetical protein QO004_002947 [Rhizobium mesoamericanum]|nr:hypothetical protein [Rhizobium mesoamericanum]